MILEDLGNQLTYIEDMKTLVGSQIIAVWGFQQMVLAEPAHFQCRVILSLGELKQKWKKTTNDLVIK